MLQINRCLSFAVVLLFVVAISGCGGGGGGSSSMDTGMMPDAGGGSGGGDTGMMPPETPAPMMPVVEVRMSTEEFTPLSNAVERDNAGPDTGVRVPAAGAAYLKSIARDGAGGFHIDYVVGDKELSLHFEPSDMTSSSAFRKEINGGVYLLIRYNQYEFTKHLDVNGWIYHEGDDVEMGSYWGYSVHGTRTAPENLPAMGSATYKGRIRADIWDADDHESSKSRTRFGSSGEAGLTLEADFGNSGISGRIEKLQIRHPGESGYSSMANTNSIDISGGNITGNSFTADWTGEDTDTSSAPRDSVRGFSGEMSGGFYGPAAEEVGGLMSGSRAGTANTPDQHLIGAFGAKKVE